MAEPKTKRRITAIFLSAFLFSVLAMLIFLFLVPIDLSGYHKRIESLIESKTGKKVLMEKVVLKALPSPEVRLWGIKAFYGDKEIIGAERAKLRFSLVPALFGSFIIQDIEVEGARADIKRDSSGKVDLLEFLGPRTEEEKKGTARVRVLSANIKNGRGTFTDESANPPAVFEFAPVDAFLYEAPGGFSYKADAVLLPSTNVSIAGEGIGWGGAVKGTATVTSFDLSKAGPYVGNKDAVLKGTADLYLAYDLDGKNSLKGVAIAKDLSVLYPGVLDKDLVSSGSAMAGLAWEKEKSLDLKVEDILLTLREGATVNGSFSLSGPPGSMDFRINAATTPLSLERIKDLVPLKSIPEELNKRLNDFTFLAGTIKLDELALKGNVNELSSGEAFRRPDAFFVKVSLDDAAFRHRALKEDVRGLKGGVALRPDALAANLSGRYSKETIRKLKASVTGLRGESKYDISVDGTFDAGETLSTAREINEALGRKPDERIDKARAGGTVELNGRISGGKGGLPQYTGVAEAKEVRVSYEGMPLGLRSVNGTVSFDNRRIASMGLAASAGGSSFTLSGYVEDYLKADPSFDIDSEGSFAGETFARLRENLSGENISIDGRVFFKANATGRASSFLVEGEADATGASIEYKKYVKKADGYPLKASASVRKSGNEFTVNHGDLDFGSSSLNLSGEFTTAKPSYSFHASSERTSLSDLAGISPFIAEDYESSGTLSFDVEAEKPAGKAGPSFKGEATLKDGKFRTAYLAEPVGNVNASASFNGNTGRLKVDRLLAGRTELSGTLEVLDLKDRLIRFDISSPRIFTEDLVPKGKEEKELKEEMAKTPGEKAKEAPAKPIKGRGSIAFKEGNLWGHGFSDFRAEVDLKERTVTFSPAGARIDGGTASGYLTLYRDPLDPLLFEADLRATGIDLGAMLKGFGTESEVLTGSLNGRFTISGQRGAAPFTAGLNGAASLHAEKGRLWKFPLLTSIFSLVNIISIDALFVEGLPYKAINGDFLMRGGVITTENLAFNSDSMRMSATGEINTNEKTMDALLAVQPFVTIDKIISKIPLAGWIITGKDKSVVSMYFGVEGPLKDPDVDVKPVKTIEKNVLGILERLIKTPIRLIMPDNEKEKKKK